MKYTLQYRDNLSMPGWNSTSLTNVQDGQTVTLPTSGTANRFFRAMLPVP